MEKSLTVHCWYHSFQLGQHPMVHR